MMVKGDLRERAWQRAYGTVILKKEDVELLKENRCIYVCICTCVHPYKFICINTYIYTCI